MSKSDSKKDVRENEEISLNVILKFIKPYDGTRENLNAFLHNCDNAISLASSNQEHIVFKFVISQLQGKAQSACSIKEFDNWLSLKEFLKNQFGERKHYAHLLTELQECRQNNQETVSQFHLRVETCLSQLLTEITISNTKKSELTGRVAAMEDLALHTFNIGLQPRIGNIVRCRDPKNLNEAVSYAISEEKIQQYSYKQNSILKTYRNDDRRSNANPVSKPNKFQTNYQTQKPSSFSPKDPFCRYCKKLGHLLEDCELRKRNNKRFENKNKFYDPKSQPSTSNFKPQINYVNEAEATEGYDTVDYDTADLN